MLKHCSEIQIQLFLYAPGIWQEGSNLMPSKDPRISTGLLILLTTSKVILHKPKERHTDASFSLKTFFT